ncbi:MAG: Phosphoglycerate dehydrogenase [Bacteriovoracaceae bacterium]|nr:Phosphoglycerate dehydrogenase [Bacteriovoracaceae bacterium]
MKNLTVLITCPPFLNSIDKFKSFFSVRKIDLLLPPVVQTLSEAELLKWVPKADAWIIGDDPASRRVLEAGVQGKLRVLVKWGIGIDNINLDAVKEFSLKFSNTPGMFGNEVADMAVGYVIGLSRQTFLIDAAVKRGEWVKPAGHSLFGKNVALFGFGDIGQNIARRLLSMGMKIRAVDPFAKRDVFKEVILCSKEEAVSHADFIILACSLNASNRHLISSDLLAQTRSGVSIVNVARGGLINEADLIKALESGRVSAAALDVFENEPLPMSSPLRKFPKCIFGTHNASNTIEAVERTSHHAMELTLKFLEVEKAG